MLILVGCMVGEISVERDECNGSYGLGGKKGSTPNPSDVFFTIQSQNKPLQFSYMMS